MKREISMEVYTALNDGILVEVARALRSKGLPLESLLWSEMADTSEARIWLIVSADEAQCSDLLARLGRIRGVAQVAVLGPGQALIKSLFAAKVLP